MKYPEPVKPTIIEEMARNKIIRCNVLQATIIDLYRNAYEEFWGVTFEQGSIHTVEEMQSVIDKMTHPVVINILLDSQALSQFIASSYDNALPDRYLSSAFEVSFTEQGTIIVGELKEPWKKPEAVVEQKEISQE